MENVLYKNLKDQIKKNQYKEWSGTQAEYAVAVAQGLIPDGTIVKITDSPTPTGDLDTHIATFIHSQSGVHGIRYYQDKLEYYDEELEEWVEIETGGGTTIVQIPSVVIGTYTYNGSEQAPVITGLDAEHTVITGTTASTTPGDFTFTIALKDPTKMVWPDMSITALTYNWSMAKAECPITVSSNSVTLDADHLTASVTLANVTGVVTVTSSDSTIATAALSGDTITISSVNQASGTATITVAVAESQNYLAGNLEIAVSAEFSQIYGVEWDGSSSPILTRTDAAEGFVDPNPYYSGMSGTPSSPFDNISPWKDMTIVHDDTAGELVKIPKFYVKIGYHSGTSGLKIQISEKPFPGAVVSPLHMDRGDGNGERNYAYIGRYPINSSYKSVSGAAPRGSTTISNFRTGIKNTGSNNYMFDYTAITTIRLLYLVEFANFSAQTKIGGNFYMDSGETYKTTGSTDNMPYHTGSMGTSRTTGMEQYRYLEGIYSNGYQVIDGYFYDGTASNMNVYLCLNPNEPSKTVKVFENLFKKDTKRYKATSFKISQEPGYKWLMIPWGDEITEDSSTLHDDYICGTLANFMSGKTFRAFGLRPGGATNIALICAGMTSEYAIVRESDSLKYYFTRNMRLG